MRCVIAIAFVVVVVALGLAVVVSGCGSREKKITLDALNNNAEIQGHSGHVKDLEFEPAEDAGGVNEFEADVLDRDGNVIGQVRGARVEGFGTHIHRIRWEGEDPGPAMDRRGPSRRPDGAGPPPGGRMGQRRQPTEEERAAWRARRDARRAQARQVLEQGLSQAQQSEAQENQE
ncbi:MAG TPA: hypothetical protein PLO37_10125 [Candidatus Hydrogenedentes bacterium]|nr:hypothetical protein [Candidatus Hydrogenedentota bacterium]HPG67190.1 hypothetical protein [Candidatus Hydrogenedentota bacterium]